MSSFAELTNEFLDAEFAESPVRASGLGLTEYDEQLDDLSEAAFDRRGARTRSGSSGSAAVDERRSDLRRARSTATSSISIAARPADRRGLRGLAPPARRLPQPRHERHLRPLPASAPTDGGAGRRGRGAHAR